MSIGKNIDLEEIIEKAKEGDKLAFNALVGEWYAKIYNFSFKYMGNEELASEVAQRTFIQVYHKLSTLKEAKSFKSWLYHIALNYCRDEHRKIKNKWTISIFQKKEKEQQQIINAIDYNRESNPEEVIFQDELSRLIQKALSEISEEQRIVIIMKEYEGLKFREIADVLNISENTAKSRLYKGLKALRKILKAYNIEYVK